MAIPTNFRTWVCFLAHGGQLAQINLGRRIQGFDGRPDLFEGKVHPRKSVGHKISFDTLVHDTNRRNCWSKNQTSKQVLIGLDDPYPWVKWKVFHCRLILAKFWFWSSDRGIVTQVRVMPWEDKLFNAAVWWRKRRKRNWWNGLFQWILPKKLMITVEHSQQEPELLQALGKKPHLAPRMLSGHFHEGFEHDFQISAPKIFWK